MRKTITILVLMVLLCSSLSSCTPKSVSVKKPSPVPNQKQTQEEQKIPEQPPKQNTPSKPTPPSPKPEETKPPELAKKQGSTKIITYNFQTKTRKILSSFPYESSDIILSPDQKKIAFVVFTDGFQGGYGYQIYTMNLDGTGLILLTKEISLFQPKNNEGDYEFTYCFSPDNLQVMLHYKFGKEKQCNKIYLLPIDGSKITEIDISHPDYTLLHTLIVKVISPMKNKENSSERFVEQKRTIKVNSETDEFLLYYNDFFGTYDWKTKKFTPILEYKGDVYDYSWTPDLKHILFCVQKEIQGEDYTTHVYDVYVVSLITKKISQFLTEAQLVFDQTIWCENGNQLIYVIKGQSRMHPNYFYQLDLETMKSALLLKHAGALKIFINKNDQRLIAKFSWDEGGRSYKYIDLKSFLVGEITLPEKHRTYDYIQSNGKNILLYTYVDPGFYNYNIENKSLTLVNKIELDYGAVIQNLVKSADQSMFYIEFNNQLFLFDRLGKLLTKEKIWPTPNPKHHLGSSVVSSFFLKPNEITFLLFSND